MTHRPSVPRSLRRPSRPARRLALATALLLLAATLPALASVVRPLPLPELVGRAQVVATAVVESSASAWVGERIVTDSVLVVDDPLLGTAAGARLVVRTLGGEVGDLGQRVFGEPVFRSGERYLLFLESVPVPDPAAGGRQPAALLRPVGMSQGALPIVASPEGMVVTPNAERPALLAPCAEASPAPWLDAPRPLADVLAEVRQAVEEAQGD